MLCSYYICRQKKNWKMCQNSGCYRQDYSGKKSEIGTNIILFLDFVSAHSSQIIGLCLMKCSSETLQNLPYSWNTKPIYFFMIHCTISFITRALCSLYYLLFAQSNIYLLLQLNLDHRDLPDPDKPSLNIWRIKWCKIWFY